MECTLDSVEYTKYSGAAIYLKDSQARILGVEVEDAIANHGGGVAAWGDDRSRIQDSYFLRGAGTMWGGCMLMEDNVSTEFHNVRFSYSRCPYGGAMDDGTTAHPFYKNCTFEYGEAIYGGAIYHYGQSYVRFEQVVFQHNVQNAATVYINAGTRPSFVDCVFYNNTAKGEAGALRSYYTGDYGPIVLDRVHFIRNSAEMHAGAVMIQSNFEFNDCVFESNIAETQGAAVVVLPQSGSNLFRNTQFLNNEAGEGGAVYFLPATAPDSRQVTAFDGCLFQGNSAEKRGGAMSVEWGLDLSVINSSFVDNRAGISGGAVHLRNIMPVELLVAFNDTSFLHNSATGTGGTLGCEEPVSETRVTMLRVNITNSTTYGNGGALHYHCSGLHLIDTFVRGSKALEGSGGAIAISERLDCKAGNGRFENVRFHDNAAGEGGGVLFFDHLEPKCRIPLAGDSWNVSANEVWSWSNFAAALQNNVAKYGNLQATAPSRVSARCDSSRCSGSAAGDRLEVDGFPGVELRAKVSLIDDFGSLIIAPGLQVEVAIEQEQSRAHLKGVTRHVLQDGFLKLSDVLVVGGTDVFSTVPVLLRLPKAMATLQDVKPASVLVRLDVCPAGYQRNFDTETNVKQCTICSSGRFSLQDSMACTVCPTGRYANSSGSSVCSTCPRGHGCPPGTTEPVACNPGFHQPAEEAADCLRCAKGSYQELPRASECISCDESQTTQGPGSVSASDCGCEANSYESIVAGLLSCKTCPEGLDCPGFDGNITLQPGYYSTLPLDPSQGVWLCGNTVVCPGQANPTSAVCKAGSTGLNCAQCLPKHVRNEAGVCEECSAEANLALPVFAAASFLAVGALHYGWNHRTQSVEVIESILFSITIGVAVAFLQQMGILDKLNFNWPGEFKAFLSFMEIFLFDLGVFSPGCVIPESFEMRYVSELLMPILVSACFVVWYFLSILANKVHHRFPRFRWSAILNSIGLVMQALYISVISVTVSLFVCYRSSTGGERVITQYPWQICYDGAWQSMLPMAVLALLVYLVGFMGILVWMAVSAPRKWKDADFRIRSRFFIFKFRVDTWWYGLVLAVRSLLLAFVPVVSPDDGYVQFVMMLFVFGSSLLIHFAILPYVDAYANMLESTELSLVCFMLAIGSWFIEDRDFDGEDKEMAFTLSMLLLISTCCCALALFGTFVYAMYSILFPAASELRAKKQVDKTEQSFSVLCKQYMGLDGAQRKLVFEQASYVDLLKVLGVVNFLNIEVNGQLPSQLSLRRLSTRALSASLEDKNMTESLEEAQDSAKDKSSWEMPQAPQGDYEPEKSTEEEFIMEATL
eukprot:TRINITY_DN11031_c0_g1_i1.p1 TRINITY_DN11031_c0_g1~~TRINITY_DN11031_c0_g1_i1.p1  ORF type:complete len:1497 (-),score=232.77 TRINITY_DN11031_c0_g1_i1:222-4178(-)